MKLDPKIQKEFDKVMKEVNRTFDVLSFKPVKNRIKKQPKAS